MKKHQTHDQTKVYVSFRPELETFSMEILKLIATCKTILLLHVMLDKVHMNMFINLKGSVVRLIVQFILRF